LTFCAGSLLNWINLLIWLKAVILVPVVPVSLLRIYIIRPFTIYYIYGTNSVKLAPVMKNVLYQTNVMQLTEIIFNEIKFILIIRNSIRQKELEK